MSAAEQERLHQRFVHGFLVCYWHHLRVSLNTSTKQSSNTHLKYIYSLAPFRIQSGTQYQNHAEQGHRHIIHSQKFLVFRYISITSVGHQYKQLWPKVTFCKVAWTICQDLVDVSCHLEKTCALFCKDSETEFSARFVLFIERILFQILKSCD